MLDYKSPPPPRLCLSAGFSPGWVGSLCLIIIAYTPQGAVLLVQSLVLPRIMGFESADAN